MDAIQIHLEQFESRLTNELIKQCTSYNILKNQLLSSPDTDEYWQRVAPEYLADAVLQVRDYPLVSVAWAAYLGMGVAYQWDADWIKGGKMAYTDYYGSEGFDNMDDHIMEHILGIDIDSIHGTTLSKIIQNLARKTVSSIHHENVEPQTKLAYLLFASASKVMFRIGVAIEMYRQGYKYTQVPTMSRA